MIDLDELIAEGHKWLSDFGGGYQDYPGGPMRKYDGVDLIQNLTEVLVAVRAERDAAVAALERVRALHRKFTYYELEDSCPDTSENHREERHHESDEIGEFYCEDMPTGDVVCDLCRDADGERMDWPCETIAALDGAPEPEEKP